MIAMATMVGSFRGAVDEWLGQLLSADLYLRTEGGPGFDPDAVPEDRRGVRESIVGRMRRHGGDAVVHTGVGAGTEVELRLERAR